MNEPLPKNMNPPKNRQWYVFIRDYLPGYLGMFGEWEPRDNSYWLGDCDLYTREQLEDNYPNDVFFLTSEDLDKILLKHFEGK